jgi:hypothetical protein
MTEPLPIVLVPGLLTSPRLYAEQLPTLWRHGPVTIAGTTHDHTIAAIASRILADAPSRFALAGLSMGGYICFKIARQAPRPGGATGPAGHQRPPRHARVDPAAPGPDRAGPQRPLRRDRRPAVPPADPPLAPPRHGGPGAGATDGRGDRGRGVHPAAAGDHRPGRLAAWAWRHWLPDAGAGGRRRPTDPTRAVGRDRRSYPGGAPARDSWLRALDPPGPTGTGHQGARGVAPDLHRTQFATSGVARGGVVRGRPWWCRAARPAPWERTPAAAADRQRCGWQPCRGRRRGTRHRSGPDRCFR